jgi:hypothetical protein
MSYTRFVRRDYYTLEVLNFGKGTDANRPLPSIYIDLVIVLWIRLLSQMK